MIDGGPLMLPTTLPLLEIFAAKLRQSRDRFRFLAM